MRVLLVHNDYAVPSGEEHAAESIARLLTDHGHEIIWFRRSSAEIGTSFASKAKALFAGIHNPFAAKSLARYLEDMKPDLVQVQNIYPLLSPSIFRPIRRRRIPVVMRCPNYRLFCPNGLHMANGQVCEKCLDFGREMWCVLRNCEACHFKSTAYALRNAWARLTRGIVRNVDMFIVQTAFQKAKFVERGTPGSRIGIVPGLVTCSARAESETPTNLVSFIGRVSPEKGIEDFLAAAELMPNVPFAVAGSNERMPNLRTSSPANVRWLGFLGPDELERLYARSRIVVVPSRWYEGFPNVVLQAMAHGRAIVVSRIGALESIVEDGLTGLHCAPGDPSDLVRKLKFLYARPCMCSELGRNARSKASLNYSRGAVYNALMAVYEQAENHSRL